MLGVLGPAMAIVSALGFLLLVGQEFNSIATVMPFLVMCMLRVGFGQCSLYNYAAIGVDDMFIVLSAWHHTNPSDSVSHRMGECLGEAAVAVTITSLTDVISFGISCWTNLPGVWGAGLERDGI
jgi:hypothetical protein